MRLSFGKKWLLIPAILILVFSALFIVSMMRTVPSGYKGVKTQWGSVVGITGEGLHWVNPIFGENIQLLSLQIQTYDSGSQSTGTIDLQEVTTNVTLNYRLDEGYVMEIFRDLRDKYESRVIRPQLEDALKATTAKFSSTEMIQTRTAVRLELLSLLKERLDPFHIVVISVSMTEFQFSPEFSAQLEATATAEKKVLEEQKNLEIVTLQQQQKVIQALADYNVTITNEQATALALAISSQAESDAIARITEQLTPEYMAYLALLQWNGELPYYWGSDAPIPFLDVGQTPTP